MEPLIVSLARKAFEAHIAAMLELVGEAGVAPPKWDDLGPEHQSAWMASVAAVRPELDGSFVDAVIAGATTAMAISRGDAPVAADGLPAHDPHHPHLIGGEFQSDKYPTTPRGKVPLSVKDPDAQDLLATYAHRHLARDAEFSADLLEALRNAGYQERQPRPTSPSSELGDDASAWAAEFMRVMPTLPAIDEGLMIGWFANAIEAACEHRIAHGIYASTPLDPVPRAERSWLCGVVGCANKMPPLSLMNPSNLCDEHKPAPPSGHVPGPFRSEEERAGYWRGFDAGVDEATALVASMAGRCGRERMVSVHVHDSRVEIREMPIRRSPPMPTTREQAQEHIRTLLVEARADELTIGATAHLPADHLPQIAEVVLNDADDPETGKRYGQSLRVTCSCGGAWEMSGEGARRLPNDFHRQVVASLSLLARQPENG